MSTQQGELLPEAKIPDDALEHLDDVPADVRKKWPKDLVAIIDMLIATYERMGYPQEEAHRLTLGTVKELALYCGGRYFYLPKGDVLDRAIRDRNLYKDWSDNGILPNELATKYRLAVQHVYRIIKEQRMYHARRVQPDLF